MPSNKKKGSPSKTNMKKTSRNGNDRLSEISNSLTAMEQQMHPGAGQPVTEENLQAIYEQTTDPLVRQLIDLRDKAQRLALFDLAAFLPEVCAALCTNQPQSMASCLSMAYGTNYNVASNHSSDSAKRQLRRELEEYGRQLIHAVYLFQSKAACENISRDQAATLSVVRLLGCKSAFDISHELHSLQSTTLQRMQTRNEAQEREDMATFLASKPLDELRKQERGYQESRQKSMSLECAEEAHECGTKAWKRRCRWTAEMFWQRAVQMNPTAAKSWTNLALARIHLGRLLRSKSIGYRQFGYDLLESAYENACQSITADPNWERGYMRAAQAVLTIGPMDRAMDACRIIKKATETLQEPLSKELVELQDKARVNANLWCRMPPRGTIPEILQASLVELRRCVVRGMAVNDFTQEEMKAAGDEIVGAVKIVSGALQLPYLHRAQWIRESKAVNLDLADIQIQLRQVSKLVPLDLVCANESLQRLVFCEDPFGLWGLDRLDRKLVDWLHPNAQDPCAIGAEKQNDLEMHEQLRRHAPQGDGSLEMSNIRDVLEWVGGKRPDTLERDDAPHNRAAFTFAIFQRILMSRECRLQSNALDRIMEIYFSLNGNGLWAGGEFIGMCVNVASGIGKYGLPGDPTRTSQFIHSIGGVTIICKEIAQSGDEHVYFQKALAGISSQTWSTLCELDVSNLLLYYILPVMDKEMLSFGKKDVTPYVETILASVLDGYPEIVKYFRKGTEPDSLRAFLPLFYSGFGIFLSRRFMSYEQTLQEQGLSSATIDVVKSMTRKWNRMSRDSRSAYRWESYDSETKRMLATMAPTSEIDIVMAREEKRGNKTKRTVIKLPECGTCGKPEGLGTVLLMCLCKKVQYCSKECQTADWANHKKFRHETRGTVKG